MCYLHPTSAPPSVLYLLLEYSASVHTCTHICVHTHIPSAPTPTPSQPASPISNLFRDFLDQAKLDASSLSHYSLTLKNICVLPQYPYFTPSRYLKSLCIYVNICLMYIFIYTLCIYLYRYISRTEQIIHLECFRPAVRSLMLT